MPLKTRTYSNWTVLQCLYYSFVYDVILRHWDTILEAFFHFCYALLIKFLSELNNCISFITWYSQISISGQIRLSKIRSCSVIEFGSNFGRISNIYYITGQIRSLNSITGLYKGCVIIRQMFRFYSISEHICVRISRFSGYRSPDIEVSLYRENAEREREREKRFTLTHNNALN